VPEAGDNGVAASPLIAFSGDSGIASALTARSQPDAPTVGSSSTGPALDSTTLRDDFQAVAQQLIASPVDRVQLVSADDMVDDELLELLAAPSD
jgi:hypothetical protein